MSSFFMKVPLKLLWNVLMGIISIVMINKYFGTRTEFGRYVFFDNKSEFDNFLEKQGITCFKAVQDILQLKGIKRVTVLIDEKNINKAEYRDRKIILGSKLAEECSLNAVISAAYEVVHSIQDKINYQRYFFILFLLFSIMEGIFEVFGYEFFVMLASVMKYAFVFVSAAFVMYIEIDATYKARNLSIEYVSTMIESGGFVEFIDKYTGNALIWYSINNIVLLIILIIIANVSSMTVSIMLFQFLK